MCINVSNWIIKEKWVFAFHEDKYMGTNLKNINLKCTLESILIYYYYL